MRIRKLDIRGFKSFPDRTELFFGAGIACVVGPNGCGKSNIVDAIRWCLGEQSARSLRGDEMMDVIFAGSTERSGVGEAEVALIFSSEGGEPFPGDYARFSEIEVTRRLRRDGGSEYLVNQSRVRRKDLVDLFLDTGVGNNLYGFIEQGRIGEIVHASPEKRRTLIDEAAGISRYKARRDEAWQHLSDTAAQLDRAADVADEMGRRLRGLELQVLRVARFRQLRALIRQDEQFLGLAKYADLAAERHELHEELTRARATATAAERDVARREADLAVRRDGLEQAEASAGATRDAAGDADVRYRELDGARSFTVRSRADLAEELEGARLARERLAVEASAAGEDLARIRADGERLLAEDERARREHAAHLAAHETAVEARRSARASLDEAEQAAAGAGERVATERARLDELDRRAAALPAVTQRLRVAADQARKESDGHAERVRKLVGAAEARRAELDLAKQAVLAALEAARGASADEAVARDAVLRAEADAVEATRVAHAAIAAIEAEAGREATAIVEAAERRRDAARSDLDAARAELAGIDRAVAERVGEQLELEGRRRGIEVEGEEERARQQGDAAVRQALPTARPLLDWLHPTEHDEPWVAAVLDERLLAPVVRTSEEVLRAAEAARSAGRATVVWSEEPSLEAVLRQVAVVDDLATALAHHAATGGTAVVRATGERVEADGYVRLGQPNGAAEGALRRRRAMASLVARLEGIAGEIDGLRIGQQGLRERLPLLKAALEAFEQGLRDEEQRARLLVRERTEEVRRAPGSSQAAAGVALRRTAAEAARREREAREARATALRASQFTAEVAVARAEGDVATAVASEERLRGRVSDLDQQVEAVAREAAGLHEQRRSAVGALAQQQGVRDAAAEALEVARSRLVQAEAGAEKSRSGLGGGEVQAAALAERLRANADLGEAGQRRVAEAAARSAAIEERIARVEASSSKALAEEQRLARETDEAGKARSELQERLQHHRDRVAMLRKELRDAEVASRDLQQRREATLRAASDLEARVREVQSAVESLCERIDERYQVSLPGLLDRLELRGSLVVEVDAPVRVGVEIGGERVGPVEPFVVRAAMLQDAELIEARVAAIEEHRVQLSVLGEVNLAAVDEYAEVAARYAELAAQRADLEASVESIRTAIARLNKTCRERFRETFDRVNENFQASYPKLVGGGSARLGLTDDEDLLDTGVDIYVQPPGKRLQNLGLLSGGEKAMAAIALLLALFQVKPSPFCVLDEVDAPLDEANGARFNDLLRGMSTLTQFIVITHNRKTMEAADTLYGITMPTPGCSRLVSVRIGA